MNAHPQSCDTWSMWMKRTPPYCWTSQGSMRPCYHPPLWVTSQARRAVARHSSRMSTAVVGSRSCTWRHAPPDPCILPEGMLCGIPRPGSSVASPPDVMVRGSPMGMYRQDFTVVHMHSRYAPASESIRRQYCRSWLRWCVRALHRARVRASHMLWLGEVGGLAKELVEREAQSRATGA